MQRTQQRRLRCKLRVSQLCGETAVEHYPNTSADVGPVISFVWLFNRSPKKTRCPFFSPAQGSYHCGSCKSGFTGDQVKGCKPELSCGNSLTNPCDINAQCMLERDGTITCQVGFHTSVTHSFTHRLSESLKGFICLVSVESAGRVTDTCVGRTPTSTDTQTRNSNAKIQTVKR